MPGENEFLDENVKIEAKSVEISDEVQPKIENKDEIIEPKKENLSRQAKKKAARFEKLKQRRQESRKFKKDLAKERKKNQLKGQEISEGKFLPKKRIYFLISALASKMGQSWGYVCDNKMQLILDSNPGRKKICNEIILNWFKRQKISRSNLQFFQKKNTKTCPNFCPSL